MSMSLCQEKAAKAIQRVIISNRQELIISGSAGTGKTYLLRNFANLVYEANDLAKTLGKERSCGYDVTATTNAAARLLDASTIFSYLGLSILHGKVVSLRKPTKRTNTVLAIDECSFIGKSLMPYIEEFLKEPTNKVIYFGDKAQLPPVEQSSKGLFDIGIDEVDMTTPLRQTSNSPLLDLCQELRSCVLDKQGFVDIREWYGDYGIHHFEDKDVFFDKFIHAYVSGERTRILTFDNPSVERYNNRAYAAIKSTSTDSISLAVGDEVVANSYFNLNNRTAIPNGTRLLVKRLGKRSEKKGDVEYMPALVSLLGDKSIGAFGVWSVNIAIANAHKLGEIQDNNDATIIDARHEYASTIHKSQGQTYDSVFIDLDTINAKDDDIFRRLMYVAISRAKTNVYFTGKL